MAKTKTSRIIDLTGKRFLTMTVKSLSYTKNGRTYWEVLCDCGIIKIIYGQALKKQKACSKKCPFWKRISHPEFYLNKTYGYCTVVEILGFSEKRNTWILKILCICGNYFESFAHYVLKINKKVNCGCKHHVPDTIFQKLYKKHYRQALRKNQLWNITEEIHHTIITQPCHYCNKYSQNTSTPGVNGMDRVNNNLGYDIENLVSCCWNCNRIKHALSIKEWNMWLENLKYQNKIEINFFNEYNVAFNNLYNTRRCGAIARNLIWEIDKNIFYELSNMNCYYCNIAPFNKEIYTPKKLPQQIFTYNGIDRLDNNINYIKENCVPCCKICNYGKNNLSAEKFKEMLNCIKEYQLTKDIIKSL